MGEDAQADARVSLQGGDAGREAGALAGGEKAGDVQDGDGGAGREEFRLVYAFEAGGGGGGWGEGDE